METIIVKHSVIRAVFALAVLPLFYSCLTSTSINFMQEKGEYQGMNRVADYKLQYMDIVSCEISTTDNMYASIFNGVLASGMQNSIRAQYSISSEGTISIPHFGDISILGLTIPQAEDRIKQKMSLSIPDVEVVVRLINKQFYFFSQHSTQGTAYIYKDNMNIFQAIALVGQMQDELIDYKKVKIIRLNENGQSVEKTFDLTSTSIIESEYYYIKPNDYIYFSTSPDRSFFRIASATQFITTITSTFTMVMGYVLMAQTLKSTN